MRDGCKYLRSLKIRAEEGRERIENLKMRRALAKIVVVTKN